MDSELLQKISDVELVYLLTAVKLELATRQNDKQLQELCRGQHQMIKVMLTLAEREALVPVITQIKKMTSPDLSTTLEKAPELIKNKREDPKFVS